MGIRVLAERYELLEEIGRGGMATVWRGRDRRLDRIVAVKIPRSELLDDVMVRRVEREARMAAGISHPNVVTVYDSGIVDGEPYVVMELVEGRPLSEAIGGMDPEEARQTAIAVAYGLAAIHAAGVIHRDVKPANVVMSSSGPKLTDFGIARRQESDRLTQPHQVMGTPAYVAPEVLAGGVSGPAADVYSLAVVVAEMVTGGRAPDLPHGLDSGDPALDDLVKAALAADPVARPSAAEFAASLRSGRLATIPIRADEASALAPRLTPPIVGDDRTRPLGDATATSTAGRGPQHQGRRAAVAAVIILALSAAGALAWRSANTADSPEDPVAASSIPSIDPLPSTTAAAPPSTSSSTAPSTTVPPTLISTPEQAAADLAAWALQIRPDELKPKDRREILSQVDKVLEEIQKDDPDKLNEPFERLSKLIGDVETGRAEGLELLRVLAESVGFDVVERG